MPFREVSCVRVDGVVAGCDVDEAKNPFEGNIEEKGFEGDAFFAGTEVKLKGGVPSVDRTLGGISMTHVVEYESIEYVHDDCSHVDLCCKDWASSE